MPICDRTLAGRYLRPAFLFLATCLLSGCVETTGLVGAEDSPGALGFMSSLNRGNGAVLRSAETAGGKVVIRGPGGYCIEGGSLKTLPARGFALLARCDILSGGRLGTPVALALLTVTVTPYTQESDLPVASDLAADFDAGDVLEAIDDTSIRLLHLATGGDAFVTSADPRQWRGLFLLNGYLVSMAAYGPKDSAVIGKAGRELLVAMAGAMREASPRAVASAATPGN